MTPTTASAGVPDKEENASVMPSAPVELNSATIPTPEVPVTPFRETIRERGLSSASSYAGGPVPFNTPMTQSVAGEFQGDSQARQNVDVRQIDDTLNTIQSLHNDAVEHDYQLPPGVPRNTPLVSPAPSSFYGGARSVHLSRIDEQLDGFDPNPLTPTMSRMNTPALSEIPEAEREESHDEQGTIQVGLDRSPSKSSASSITVTPGSFEPPLTEEVGHARRIPSISMGADSRVKEHTDWSGHIEEELDRDLTRLENLAIDDWQNDGSKPAATYFAERLHKVLRGANRKFAVADLPDLTSIIVEREPPVEPPVKAHMVTAWEFDQLKTRFESLLEVLDGTYDYLAKGGKDEDLKAIHEELRSIKKAD